MYSSLISRIETLKRDKMKWQTTSTNGRPPLQNKKIFLKPKYSIKSDNHHITMYQVTMTGRYQAWCCCL